MPVTTNNVVVGTSPTRLFESSAARRDFHVYNGGTEAVYIGGADVTPQDGIPLQAGGIWWLQQAHPTDACTRYPWYAVSGGADVTLRVLEVGG